MSFFHKSQDDRMLKFIDKAMIIPAKTDPNNIRITTYNVHGFKNFKKIKMFDEIIKVISDIDPDIIIIEEVFVFKRNETFSDQKLIGALNDIGLCNYIFSSSGINAVFSKFAIDKENSVEIDLGKDNIRHIPRNAIVTKFIDLPNFVVIGTHLDVFDETGETRVKQIKKIINTIDKSNFNIICGDFNSLRKKDYTVKQWHHINNTDKERGVKTIEDVIPCLEDENNFIESFNACKLKLNVSVWANRRVDYIYSNLHNFKNSFAYTSSVSDHYPVSADVYILNKN
jgi:endonuclease/exonuclease/phosphatase family metal-dependent hydrolase